METKDYTSLLKGFISGKVTLDELRDKIDDRLFDLREQSPELTEEEKLLSPIELLICEINDGFRPVSELEHHIRTLISGKKPVQAQ